MGQPRHFLTLGDLGREGLLKVIATAEFLKRVRGTDDHPQPLRGRTVVVLLEKASTRTRLSFEVGIHELGGFPITLLSRDTQLGRGEPLEDTARMLSGYAHAVVYRTFEHDRVLKLASASTIPVVNGLTDSYHPCQLLADLMTIREHNKRDLRDERVAWIGDGNNMAHSWMMAAGLLGFQLTIAAPEGYDPDPQIVERARQLGGGEILITREPADAARGATVITTDVWASMGQEGEAQERQRAFGAYQVNAELMAQADPNARFLHCLPAHRGEEVTSDVIDGPQSMVWAEAENRLHTQKALLMWIFDR